MQNLEFKPLVRFFKFGNEIQRCETKYKGVGIMQETYFPYNFLKEPTDSFMVDRIVKVDSKIPNAEICENFYTEQDYGYPVFKTLENAIEYIDSLN